MNNSQNMINILVSQQWIYNNANFKRNAKDMILFKRPCSSVLIKAILVQVVTVVYMNVFDDLPMITIDSCAQFRWCRSNYSNIKYNNIDKYYLYFIQTNLTWFTRIIVLISVLIGLYTGVIVLIIVLKVPDLMHYSFNETYFLNQYSTFLSTYLWLENLSVTNYSDPSVLIFHINMHFIFIFQ